MKVHKQLMIITLTAMLLMASLIVIPQETAATDPEAADWYGEYAYRKYHDITGAAGAGTGYQIMLTVHYGTGVDSGSDVYLGGKCQADFGDLRFTADDGITPLPYWIQASVASSYATVWVKVSDDLGTDQSIYLYYGDPDVASVSSGWLTWDVFDDFSGSGTVWGDKQLVIPTPSTDYAYCEPSVIYEADAQIIVTDEPVFKIWFRAEKYSTNDVWIMYSESFDGVTWQTPVSVLNTAEVLYCPYVLKVGSSYYMYVHSDWDNFDRWVSSNGINWAKDQDNTLSVGASGQWDDWTLGNIFVWEEAGVWYCIYEAHGGDYLWKGGMASSADGKAWTKSASNPIVGGTGHSFGGPFVQKIGDRYYMWYHGSTAGHMPTDFRRAYSTDLVNWIDEGYVFNRTETWEGVLESEGQVGDPEMITVDGQTYMFYEAVETQDDHSGLAVVKTSLSIPDLTLTKENFVYAEADYWNDANSAFVVSGGVGTLSGGAGTYNWTKVWGLQNVSVNSRVLFKQTVPSIATGVGSTWGIGTSAYTDSITYSYHTTSNRIKTKASNVETSVESNLTAGAHTYQILWTSGKSVSYMDGCIAQGGTVTTNVPSMDLVFDFECSGTGKTVIIDYLAVGSYIENGPTSSVWGAEEEMPAAPVDPDDPGSGAFGFTSAPVTSALNGTAYSYDADVNVSGAAFTLITDAAWLSINATTGVVSGTPDATGAFNVTIQATVDGTTVNQTYIVTVSEGLISPGLMNGMIEMIVAAMLLMAMVSVIGMVKVKKR